MLDDLGEVQIDLQQQVLAPLAHRTEREKGQTQWDVCNTFPFRGNTFDLLVAETVRLLKLGEQNDREA